MKTGTDGPQRGKLHRGLRGETAHRKHNFFKSIASLLGCTCTTVLWRTWQPCRGREDQLLHGGALLPRSMSPGRTARALRLCAKP